MFYMLFLNFALSLLGRTGVVVRVLMNDNRCRRFALLSQGQDPILPKPQHDLLCYGPPWSQKDVNRSVLRCRSGSRRYYFLSCISAIRGIHPRMPVIISPRQPAAMRRRNSTTIQTDSPTIPTPPVLPHRRRSRTSRPN